MIEMSVSDEVAPVHQLYEVTRGDKTYVRYEKI